MSSGTLVNEAAQWRGILFRWALIPILLVTVLIWDSFFIKYNKNDSIGIEDALLLSSRTVPKAVQNFFGQGYRRPQNLDFRETDSLGYPKHWHFPTIQMLDGYRLQNKPSANEDGPSLRISRDEPIDAPSTFRGITLSQVWDVEGWDDTQLDVGFMASFQPDVDASDSAAYVSILVYPKSGRDPTVFRKQIVKSSDLEPYRIEVKPTEKSDWMVCSIMTVGDGNLCVHPLSLSNRKSAEPIDQITSDLQRRSTQPSTAPNSTMLLVLGMMGLSMVLLGLSYREGKSILVRSYMKLSG